MHFSRNIWGLYGGYMGLYRGSIGFIDLVLDCAFLTYMGLYGVV